MSSLLDEVPDRTADSHAAHLQSTMAAARLSFHWLGVRKSLTSAQKNQAADSFGAEGKFLSAGKKLLDTSHPAYKAVTAVRSQTIAYWKSVSLPFPEAGIRLLRQDSIAEFDQQIHSYQHDLHEAVLELDRHYDQLRRAAQDRLGDLFNITDYPATLVGMFSIEHEFPSLQPPNYLQQLNPELYEAECRRVQARFDEAVQMAEAAFIEELAKLVEHLTERLNGAEDGKPKIFRDTAIRNMTTFFERFRALNVRSNEQLDELVANAQQIVQGVHPQQLRDSQVLRQKISSQMAAVQSELDQLLVDRPRRNIQRRPK